jgi:hypothetical protein
MSLDDIVKQWTVTGFAPSFWSIKMIVTTRLRANVTLHVAAVCFGASHFVTPIFFDERGVAYKTH